MLSIILSVGAQTGCQGIISEPLGPQGPRAADDRSAELACSGTPKAGVTPLRRLTRVEYARSVQTALELATDVASGFSPDERIGGVFVSNLDAALASVQLGQYLDAAEQVSAGIDLGALDGCDVAERGAEACARQFVERIFRRLYRRPLTADELARYVDAYTSLREGDDHETALRVLVQAALQSPHFIYHVELDDPEAPVLPEGVARLPAFARAARLSFLLWGSGPDDALLDAAAAGELDDEAGVRAAAERLLADARAADAIGEFHSEWLGLDRLDEVTRDSTLFPEFSPELVDAVRAEARAFSDYVVREAGGDLQMLLTSAMSFPRGKGLALLAENEARAMGDGSYEFDSRRRAGLLTQPAFLLAHAHADQTSPIRRGRALRERFFCQKLPDPPPAVAAEPPDIDPALTTRERYAQHRTAGSACFGCHSLIDDLGFALEHYDALGRYRETENDKPIDASGMLTGTDIDGEIDGASALAARMSESTQVKECYGRQWFQFAFGRAEQKADKCSVETLEAAVRRGEPIQEMLLELVTSSSFLYHAVER